MNRISSRPRVQGNSSPRFLRHSGQPLTDGAGLLALRALWDRLDLGSWLDDRLADLPDRFRPSLMIEVWVALLWYGGGWLSDLELLRCRGIRRLFGWARVLVTTTFGRWLRRAGKPVSRALDELIRKLIRRRWKRRGVPDSVTLVLDSTVVVRYGEKQAGAETGYNPKKPGRPSHHPLLAFTRETGDLIGLRWRPGSAWAADGVEEWLPELVTWLREAGVEEVTVRLDKGFYAERVVQTLQELEVSYLLKVPNHGHVRDQLGAWRKGKRADGIFEEMASVHTSSGRLWGDRVLSLEGLLPSRGRTPSISTPGRSPKPPTS